MVRHVLAKYDDGDERCHEMSWSLQADAKQVGEHFGVNDKGNVDETFLLQN
jgi:hypothetical protein